MKTKLVLAAALSTVFFSAAATARDDIQTLPLADIIGTDKAKQALLDVPFYFAGQNHATVMSNWGEISTNKKTNGLGKSDQEACQWVLLSAIKALQDAAQKRGYDAVVNIRSNYKNNEFTSTTEFQCGAGRIMAGVALKGELVKF
ncbi:excinuclease ABC subunit A [Rheinheimera salexigens]|uniref:Excinuclease ABC subunit A n=1 Tax=Rheinheimera salexigens TaxID=1628148 RepID=A0A1E7Q2M5_9GAMM|nr:excinuclease ABC subunit A [Rheinheimera salexigens]OEY68407.1 excinuclease ABC subunit A [Rheinheimera salexigens]